MKNTKEIGITLIALIITIIVMLIFAGVTISIVANGGLFDQARNASIATRQGVVDEEISIWKANNKVSEYTKTGYISSELFLDDLISRGVVKEEEVDIASKKITIENKTWSLEESETEDIKIKTIAEVQESYVTENTMAEDKYENKIVIPEGFKVTSDTDKVAEGIVITDGTNEFVWVPVGQISNGTATKEIKLSRYEFDTSGNPIDRGADIIDSYFQETATSTYGNTTAKNLQDFLDSVNVNGGYYLGRYEASDADATEPRAFDSLITNKMVCRKGGYVYDYITQLAAADLCKDMYSSNSFTSDLVNSYAWDTAIIFIQAFGQNNYSKQTALISEKRKTGLTEDEQLHINDMAGNVCEWTTEASSNSGDPCIARGGNYIDGGDDTALRYDFVVSHTAYYNGFRPLLYL